jgi:voltage-gated potassium channel
MKDTIDLFDDPNSKVFTFVNNILAFVTLISVFVIVLETVQYFTPYYSFFKGIEYAAAVLFTLEYIWRLHLAKPKRVYALSFFGIIDLLAILPTFIGLGNLTFLKTTRVFRILRFLRMVRLAKVARMNTNTHEHSFTFISIEIYAVALLSSLIFLGTLLFIFEGTEQYATNIPLGMYWTFKVLLGGIAYEQPISIGGTVVLITARFIALILLGLMLNLVTKLTRKALTGADDE